MAAILSNATGGGLASATTSWAGGVVPVLGDSVNIVVGDTIEIDGTYSWGDDTANGLIVNGIIKASRTVSSDLTVRGDFNITGVGSDFDYGTSASIIPSTITAIIRLNDSAVLARGKWGLILATNAGYHVYGSTRTTNTHLTALVLAAATSFTVTDATGWAIGDTIVLGATYQGNQNAQDEIVISAITGNTITFTTATVFQHEINCPVGNFTKNVKIMAVNSAYESYQDLKHNTTLVSREIQHLEVLYMGSNTSSVKYGAVRLDGQNTTGNPYTSIGNVVGYSTNNNTFDVYGCFGRMTIDDCASYRPTGGFTAFYARQSGVATFNRCYAYKQGTAFSSSWSQGGVNCIFNDCWASGSSTGMSYSSAQGFIFNNCVFHNNVTAVSLGWGARSQFNNCDIGYQFSAGNGINKFGIGFFINGLTESTFTSCNWYNTTDVGGGIVGANPAMKVILANKNGSPANQEIYLPTGTFKRDNTQFKTGTASLQANPTSATVSLLNEWDIFAPSGKLVVVSGYLRKNTSYGSATLPKVTLTGLGIVDSVFTMTDVNDTYVQFTVSGSQTTGTDGILTLRAEFQSGNAGAQAWIDGIVAPVSIPVNSGDIGYWAGGQPAKLIAANFTSPDDIWNKLAADITLPGSIGKQLKDNIDIKTSSSGVIKI